MRKLYKHNMYKKISIMDVIVVITSIIALAALLFVVKYSRDRSNLEKAQLAETGSIEQGMMGESSMHELSDTLVINEVNSAGWIELYNKDKKGNMDLSRCYISVNSEKKYTFPEMEVIEAGGFLCVDGLGQLGNSEHDIIGIYTENGDNLKIIMLPALENEESYGCRTDGDISYCYLNASREISNNNSNVIKKDRLTFSVPGGFYDESFHLEITAAEGSTIYYTLDGTEPTIESEGYKEPILIENKSGSNMKYAIAEGIEYLYYYQPSSISIGMIIRAIAVDPAGKRSEIKTQSYFIGMKEASDIRNIPVLSIITPPDNLFDYFEGIYVTGRSYEDALARGESSEAANYLNGWEREVHIEYFEPQKDKTFEGDMSISMIKDYSRIFPQKSLLLTAEGGAFQGSSLANYYNEISNRLVVLTNRKDNNYKIREYLAARLLEKTTVGTPDITPCIVFINGEYWGGYMLSTEYDERYIHTHYDVDEEEVLIARNGTVNKADYQKEFYKLHNFITDNDLKEEDNYEWVKAHMDVQNYLEYFCANMYLANAEYGQDSLVMWKTINNQGTGYEDGRWRFLMPRLDNTMKNKEAGKIASSSINTFLQAGAREDKFFSSLLRNDEFKKQLLLEMTKMGDDIFASERVEFELSEISKQIKKMVLMNCKRFTANVDDTYYTKEEDRIESFFVQRKEYILRYTEEVISQGGIVNFYDGVFE